MLMLVTTTASEGHSFFHDDVALAIMKGKLDLHLSPEILSSPVSYALGKLLIFKMSSVIAACNAH